MKWLEVIEFRISECKHGMLKTQLQSLINEIGAKAQKHSITVYRLETVDTDISIHILHDSEIVKMGGSSFGLHLASALREFGLVNHKIWIQTHGK